MQIAGDGGARSSAAPTPKPATVAEAPAVSKSVSSSSSAPAPPPKPAVQSTTFTTKPAASPNDDDTRSSIAEAAARAAAKKADAPEPKPKAPDSDASEAAKRRSREHMEAKLAAIDAKEMKDKRNALTENVHGEREKKSSLLDSMQHAAETAQQVLQHAADEKNAEAAKDQAKAGALGTVTGLLSFGGGLGKLVTSAAEHLFNVAGDKQSAADAAARAKSAGEQANNYGKMSANEAAYALRVNLGATTGIDARTIQLLDTGSTKVGANNVTLNSSVNIGMGAADASYSSADKSVNEDAETHGQTVAFYERARKAGAVDAHGNILDLTKLLQLDGAKANQRATSVTEHELTHAEQDSAGTTAQTHRQIADIMHRAIVRASLTTNTADRARILEEARAEAQKLRVSTVEVGAYNRQERSDLTASQTAAAGTGATTVFDKKAYFTIDKDGNDLPADQQAANLIAFENGTPLPYGVSKGYTSTERVLGPEAQMAAAALAQTNDPGRWLPGRWLPANSDPGRWLPANDDPGRWLPANGDPGRWLPANTDPGRWLPANDDPGRWLPGKGLA